MLFRRDISQTQVSISTLFGVMFLGLFGADSFAQEAAPNEPAVIGALKSEPLSLFDWGLFTLEEELQSVLRHRRDFIRASYNPKTNQISIDGVFFVERNEIHAINAERACYKRLHAIKLTLGIIDTDRINLAPAARFRLGLKFSHRDADHQSNQTTAEEIGEQLMGMIYITVGIGSDDEQFPFLQDMRCSGALLSQEVGYSAGITDHQGN